MSHGRTIDTIVFDFGGVLVDWDPRYLYKTIFSDKAEMEMFLKDIATPDWNSQQDAGRPFATAVAELIQAHPKYAAQIRAYHDRWGEMIKGSIEGTVKILKELKERGEVRLYGLSNWSSETFPIALKRFDFFSEFDGILLSGDVKMIKPDPRFYQLLCSRFKIDPHHAVFIDDVEKNIVAARALGFDAVLFSTPENLRAALRERSLL